MCLLGGIREIRVDCPLRVVFIVCIRACANNDSFCVEVSLRFDTSTTPFDHNQTCLAYSCSRYIYTHRIILRAVTFGEFADALILQVDRPRNITEMLSLASALLFTVRLSLRLCPAALT